MQITLSQSCNDHFSNRRHALWADNILVSVSNSQVPALSLVSAHFGEPSPLAMGVFKGAAGGPSPLAMGVFKGAAGGPSPLTMGVFKGAAGRPWPPPIGQQQQIQHTHDKNAACHSTTPQYRCIYNSTVVEKCE